MGRLAAPVATRIHAVFILTMVVTGWGMLALSKGDLRHRVLGWSWIAAMTVMGLTSMSQTATPSPRASEPLPRERTEQRLGRKAGRRTVLQSFALDGRTIAMPFALGTPSVIAEPVAVSSPNAL